MPVPVLVLDAVGQPLMPLAAAHARKLLARGRAHRFPHPALTIVRLDHRVDQPVLRPVMVGVVVHATTAELFFLAAGPRTTFPLLYVVIDGGSHQRPRSLHRRRATTLSPTHLNPMVAVLDSLRRFLPLSHIVLMQSSYRIRDGLRSWIQQAGIREIGPYTKEDEFDTLMSLYAALTNFVADPRQAGQVLVALPRPHIPRSFSTPSAPPTIGVVDALGIAGVLDETTTVEPRVPVLRVAVSASREVISWQDLVIPTSMEVQEWTGRGAALIPVVQLPGAALPFVLW